MKTMVDALDTLPFMQTCVKQWSHAFYLRNDADRWILKENDNWTNEFLFSPNNTT